MKTEVVVRCYEHMFVNPRGDKECKECNKLRAIAKETAQDERIPCEYDYCLSFDRAQILSGQVIDLCTRPQLPFRPRRLVVSQGAQCIIDSIHIGTMMEVSIGMPQSMPAELFAVGAWPLHFKMDKCPVGIDVKIRIVNQGTCSVYPLVVLLGNSIDREMR